MYQRVDVYFDRMVQVCSTRSSIFEKIVLIASFYGIQLLSGRLKLKVRNTCTALSMEMPFDSFDRICKTKSVVNGD